MSDTVIFLLVFGGFFVLRAVVGDRCPNCDAVTLRVESRVMNRLLPMFRTSWCYECNWHGLLRRGPLTPAPRLGESVVPTKRP